MILCWQYVVHMSVKKATIQIVLTIQFLFVILICRTQRLLWELSVKIDFSIYTFWRMIIFNFPAMNGTYAAAQFHAPSESWIYAGYYCDVMCCQSKKCVLYYTIIYCTILYCTVLYCAASFIDVSQLNSESITILININFEKYSICSWYSVIKMVMGYRVF